MSNAKIIAALTIAFASAGIAPSAFAQGYVGPPPTATPAPGTPPPASDAPAPWGTPPPPPPYAVAPNGQYVAPLQQTTQPSYVPQSVALSGPRFIKDWQPGEEIPYGYHPESRVRKGAIIGGAIAFGVPYLYSALIASAGSDLAGASGDNKVADLYVPVFGPFMEMSQTSSATARYVLMLDGLAQGIGAGLFIYGVVSPKPILVRNDLALVTVTPVRMGQDGNGIGVMGRF
jgi:hypothetical protein